MQIGIFSDTHENMPLIEKAVRFFNERGVSLVLHAGDIISPMCITEFKKLHAKMILVFGNNDGERRIWKERIKDFGEIYDQQYETEIEGKKLLLVHDPAFLEGLIQSQLFDVIIYGHTHKTDNRLVGKTLIFNPGECGGWLTGRSTIGILELGQKKATIVDL